MLTTLLIATFISILVSIFAKSKKMVKRGASLFYIAQICMAAYVITLGYRQEAMAFFTFDALGVIFYTVMVLIASVIFFRPDISFDKDDLKTYKIYNISFILLCLAITGVYFANNVAVTWIFLEATSLASAAIIYHRRNIKTLEATWKYVFVCSVGIAIAYLGILLLIYSIKSGQSLSYTALQQTIATANPLYLKLAFIFILTGYSCKMEIFPLHTVGVDANYSAPTQGSAFISTALVNAGFVSIFRIYKLMIQSLNFGWVCNVMMLVGVFSILIAAVYLRRTNNYKRFFAYSTVENMGLVAIALGIGNYMGMYAAILHALVHALVKSSMFLQLGQIGRQYKTYRINRIGNYFRVDKVGASVVLWAGLALLAFPVSGLFVSEYVIYSELIGDKAWITLIVVTVLLCLIMYSITTRILKLCYRENDISKVEINKTINRSSYIQLILLILGFIICYWQPQIFDNVLDEIIR